MRFYKNNIKIGEADFTVVTVNQEEGEVQEVIAAPSKTHHIQILDRSGSMSSHINTLIEQVKQTLDVIPETDLISIIWFSSPGEYKTLVKGATKSPELIRMLDSLKSVIGTTCFSDPIREAKSIVTDLKALCPTFNITLFTDGNPVTPWSQKEEEQKCYTLLKEFGKDILAFNTIAYGYGSVGAIEFLRNLSGMSEFGMQIYSSDIMEYVKIFENNFSRIRECKVESVHIEYPLGIDGIYLNRNFSKSDKLELYLSRLDKNKNQFFLIGTGDFEFFYNGEKKSTKDISEEVANPTIQNFMYAYAYNLYYSNRCRESLEVLNTLRDKALIDSHMSAFTWEEKSEHIKTLENAMLNTSNRKKEGESKPNYLPAKDAFCVFDVLQMFASQSCFYVPNHPAADEYKRIGRKTEDKTNLFESTEDTYVSSLSELVFNKERVNVSLRFTVPGIVNLNKTDAKSVNLPETVEAFVYRNHSIIKDGDLNLKKIVVLMPENTFDAIQEKRKILEVVESDKQIKKDIEAAYGQKYVYALVRLNRLPVINATYTENLTAPHVFEMSREALDLECVQKYLNSYWKQFETNATAAQKKVGLFEDKSAEQIAVLEAHGINKDGSYRPLETKVATKDECKDSYETKSFAFTFKSFSSLPKLEELEDRLKAKKALTPALEKLLEAKTKIENAAKKAGIDLSHAVVATRDWLRDQMSENKARLFELRSKLAATKLAVLLTGANFEGFEQDAKQNFVYEAKGMTLVMKAERVVEYL